MFRKACRDYPDQLRHPTQPLRWEVGSILRRSPCAGQEKRQRNHLL